MILYQSLQLSTIVLNDYDVITVWQEIFEG